MAWEMATCKHLSRQRPLRCESGLHCPQGCLTTCTHVKQLLLEVGLRRGTQGRGDGDPLQPEVQ